MRILLAVILSSLIVGCSSPPKVPDAIAPPAAQKVDIDPRVLQPCKELLTVSQDSLIENTIKNIEIYADCARKQDASIKLLKQFSNTGGN